MLRLVDVLLGAVFGFGLCAYINHYNEKPVEYCSVRTDDGEIKACEAIMRNAIDIADEVEVKYIACRAELMKNSDNPP